VSDPVNAGARWVTRSGIHIDRVASPWLIRRFVDPEATFGFVDPDDPLPAGAVAFAIPGAPVGPHDTDGSAFRKILRVHDVQRPELERMAEVVEVGIAIATGKAPENDRTDVLAHGAALAAFSEAVVILRDGDDHAVLRDSAMYYDALYLTLWSAYGVDAPALPADIVERLGVLRSAAEWRTVLPAWDETAHA